MNTFLGIDIGGSSFKYGWGSSTQGLQYFSSLTIRERNLPGFYSLAKELLAEVDKQIGMDNICAIGIGSAGTIDRLQNKLTGVNPNLPFWTNQNPSALIPTQYRQPVFCDNDANLMALAEAKQAGYNHILGITVGSGIGCGLIIDGMVYQGAHGFAGELGHVCMVDGGALCTCGKRGCLEAYTSVDGWRRGLIALEPSFTGMTLTQLLELKALDNRVQTSHQAAQSFLCQALANAIVCFDPEAVIIGGGGMDAGMYSIEAIAEEVQKLLPVVNIGRTKIQKAFWGNKAGVWGAITHAEQLFLCDSE